MYVHVRVGKRKHSAFLHRPSLFSLLAPRLPEAIVAAGSSAKLSAGRARDRPHGADSLPWS
jgi:hypothetical protein